MTTHSTPKPNRSKPKDDDPQEIPESLHHLPRDVGWMLLVTGLVSELGMPGVPPFWIAGLMILWPETGQKIAKPMARRFPKAYGQSMKLIHRFVDDLDRRYPQSARKSATPESRSP